jgi:hypothetical protein
VEEVIYPIPAYKLEAETPAFANTTNAKTIAI